MAPAVAKKKVCTEEMIAGMSDMAHAGVGFGIQCWYYERGGDSEAVAVRSSCVDSALRLFSCRASGSI